MATKSLTRLFAALAWLLIGVGAPAMAQSAGDDAALLSEVRRAFTLHGKPIPPEIFRNFGDGDLADSGSIWVTVDKTEGKWLSQKRANQSLNGSEETSYNFIGATDNGLLAVLATYNGGGSGTFYTLHILDVAVARAFDGEGKRYRRINLTVLRSVAIGDRWDGEVSIAHNAVRIVTTRKGLADAGTRSVQTIAAERP
jgi:hypothetical protein